MDKASENEKDPAAEQLLPAEREPVTWEIVLARAARADAEEAAAAPGRLPRAPWAMWARAAVPLVILAVYAVYKVSQIEFARPRPPEPVETVSLSGLKNPAPRVEIDRETEQFIRELDRLFSVRTKWGEIVTAVAAAPPKMQDHPIVQAYESIARVEQGVVSGALQTRIRELLPVFESDRNRRELYEYLRLAEAKMVLRGVATPEEAFRRADYFRQVARNTTTIPAESLRFRVRLADRYERLGDMLLEESGSLRVDKVKVSDARSLYQNALRWVITPEGWMRLEPLSSGQAATVRDRLLVKIEQANKKYHGPVLPFGGNDNSTWSGKAGDPLHDLPGGAW